MKVCAAYNIFCLFVFRSVMSFKNFDKSNIDNITFAIPNGINIYTEKEYQE